MTYTKEQMLAAIRAEIENTAEYMVTTDAGYSIRFLDQIEGLVLLEHYINSGETLSLKSINKIEYGVYVGCIREYNYGLEIWDAIKEYTEEKLKNLKIYEQ